MQFICGARVRRESRRMCRSFQTKISVFSVPRSNALAPSQGQTFGLVFDLAAKISVSTSVSTGLNANILVSVSVWSPGFGLGVSVP